MQQRQPFAKEELALQYYLAIDIGASSGRHIVGWVEDGRIQTREVYRFPNGVKEENGNINRNINGIRILVKEKGEKQTAR